MLSIGDLLLKQAKRRVEYKQKMVDSLNYGSVRALLPPDHENKWVLNPNGPSRSGVLLQSVRQVFNHNNDDVVTGVQGRQTTYITVQLTCKSHRGDIAPHGENNTAENMSGSTLTPGGEPCSQELYDTFSGKYDMKYEVWAICAISDVFIAGPLEECPCGKSAADWVEYWKVAFEAAAKDEKRQIEDQQSKEEDKSEDFPNDAYNAFSNKPSVKALFIDHFFPYFVEHPGEWDTDIFGAEWVDLVTAFIAKYEALNQKDRPKYLDRIRHKAKIEDKVKELKDMMS